MNCHSKVMSVKMKESHYVHFFCFLTSATTIHITEQRI